MKTENFILVIIGISFAGFLAGLVGKNVNTAGRKSFRYEGFFKYLMAISVIVMLVMAFLYKILTF